MLGVCGKRENWRDKRKLNVSVANGSQVGRVQSSEHAIFGCGEVQRTEPGSN